MASIGDLVANLRISSQGWDSGLAKGRKSLGGFVKNVTSGFAQIGLAANGLQTVWSSLSAPINEALEGMQEDRKLAQVFKSTGNAAGLAVEQIQEFAKARQNVTNFDAGATTNAAGLLGSFTAIKGDIFMQALASAQDLSAFMGSDLESSIMQIGKALNDPARGVSALAKSGIQFTQAQKEQIKALQETGRIADAQQIILKELQTQFGGQAEALVNPIVQAENAWKDFLSVVGEELLEHIIPLMPKVIEGIQKMADVAGKAFEQIAAIAGKIQEFNDALAEISDHTMGATPDGLLGALSPFGDALHDALGREGAKPFDGDIPAMGLAGAIKKGLPQLREKQAAKAAADATAAEEAAKLKKQNEMAAQGALMAEKQMAEWIRGGIAGLQAGVMSLGPVKEAEKFSNQVGSLEANSQEAFDVLRANVGGPQKDKVQEQQLKEQQKQTKKLDEIASSLSKSAGEVFKVMGFN